MKRGGSLLGGPLSAYHATPYKQPPQRSSSSSMRSSRYRTWVSSSSTRTSALFSKNSLTLVSISVYANAWRTAALHTPRNLKSHKGQQHPRRTRMFYQVPPTDPIQLTTWPHDHSTLFHARSSLGPPTYFTRRKRRSIVKRGVHLFPDSCDVLCCEFVHEPPVLV